MEKKHHITLFTSFFKTLFFMVILSISWSCADEEPSLSDSFLKIYDDSDLDVNYKPIDVVETSDGFIILAGTELSKSDFAGVRLLKLDEEGNYEFDRNLDNYVVPVGGMYLNEADSNSYFFVMDPTSLEAVLIGVTPQLEIQTEALVPGINYPLSSASLSSGNLLLQSYDPLNQATEISEIGLDGGYIGGSSYFIGPGDDVEEEIINHYLNASERPLPFFCGEVSAGQYFFNGFYNYSFSLVFTDFGASPSGVLQGQSSNAGLRAALALGGNNFAVAGYQFDANFQLATTTLATDGISSSVDLFPGNMAEIKAYTSAQIISYTRGDTYAVFAAETKGNQILLNFYDSNGNITGIHRIGFLNPYSFSSIRSGENESLLVLGTTFVAGRFERIMLNKIAASEISGLLN